MEAGLFKLYRNSSKAPTPPGVSRTAAPPPREETPPENSFHGGPVDTSRLQNDPTYRRAYEDWLDHQDNLRRTPDETRRTDLLFLALTALLTLVALVLFRWLFSGG
jgi:hypothetical protein